MKKAAVLSILVAFVLFALAVQIEAQLPKNVYRLGYLSSGTGAPANDPGFGVFRQRLQEFGYVEGQNLVIETRYAKLNNRRLPDLAAELVNLKVDVILTTPDEPTIRAAQSATRTIPVVMPGSVTDPLAATVWAGKHHEPLVVSLAKPGGNFTGLSNFASVLHPKRLELLIEAFPRISRVAILWPRAQQQKQTLKDIDVVRQALGIEIQSLATGTLKDFASALSAMSQKSPDALLVARSQVTLTHRNRVIDFAAKKRLPSIFAERLFVVDGGLMSYDADGQDLYRRAATYVDKILKGTKPSELPIEQPMKFDFVINLKVANQLGLTIPPNVLVRANRVIK